MATYSYPVRRRSRHLARLLVPLLCCACQDACERHPTLPGAGAPGAAPAATPAQRALAHLEALQGDVRVQRRGNDSDVAGAEALALAAEDVVKTGADGQVDVVFDGNNRVHLGANAALLIHDTGVVQTQVGAVVLKGSVRASSGGSGVGLNIGTPLGMAKLGGDKIAVLEVDMGKGLHLATGEVVLARPDRLDVLPLQLGQTLHLDALPLLLQSQQMLDVPAVTVDNLAPPPAPSLPARLQATTGGTERQAGGRGAFRQARVGDLLGAGDRVRVASGNSADVALADGMQLRLTGGEVVLAGTDETPEGRRARYALNGGQAQLRITTHEGRPVHEATVAGLPLRVAPGAREAKVDVTQADPRGNAHVVVRYGQAQLGNDVRVEAGQAVDVANGKSSAPYPAFAAPVDVAPGQSTVLYVHGQPPPLRFGDAPGKTAHHVEFSSEPNFVRVAAAEDTHQPFASDELPMGTTYWRTGGDRAPTSKLELRVETQHGCNHCARQAAIDDDGQASVIMYQSALPDTTLRWSEVAEAKGYRLSLARADAPNLPVVDKVVHGSEYTVPADALSETDYTWSVTPLDANDAPLLAQPKGNPLRFAYDNVVRGLMVRGPSDNATVRGTKVVTEGAVELGHALQINGQPVKLSDNGEFHERVALTPGKNRLVYRVTAPNAPEQIYVRNVTQAAPGGRRRRK